MGINPTRPVYHDLGMTALFLLGLVLLPAMASMDSSAASTSLVSADVVAQWRLFLVISAPSWFAAVIILVETNIKSLVNRAMMALKGVLYL